MNIKVGCDLVSLKRFKKSVEKNGTKFLEKIFCPQELLNSNKLESLAGIFAAKEAAFKALEMTTDNWLNVQILKRNNGKPILNLINFPENYSCDISISHDGNYVFAVVSFLIL